MWSPAPVPDVEINPGLGWSADGPQPPPTDPLVGWWATKQALASFEGSGEFRAVLLAHLLATAVADGSFSASAAVHLLAKVIGEGSFPASVAAHLNGQFTGAGEFSARLALPASASFTGTGSFQAMVAAHLLASAAQGEGFFAAGQLAHLIASFTGAGSFSASAAFSPVEPVTTAFTTVGAFSYPIPGWCTYLDLIVLGGGRGGQTGSGANSQPGSGGLPGEWAVATLQRGVNIPWSEAQLTGTVGAGGAGGANSDNAAGQPGGNSTVVASVGTLTGLGGTGVNSGSTRRDGPGPGNYTYLGTEYVGGALSDGSGLPGNPPGGGGSGGNGGVFGNRTRGGAGARGQVWIRARQS
ncbi:hypothetical protein SEA_FLOAT294_47 [Gordonia phage Float294]|nr:hypothetical protein SEA_FLOAT294_47 [Gordonia phage Float294]